MIIFIFLWSLCAVGWCEESYLVCHRSLVNLTDCCKLKDTAARDKFIYKLHRGLISLQLPVKYACLLCLAACWTSSSEFESSSDSSVLCKSDVVRMLESNVARRRQLLSTVPPASLTSNETMLVYFLSICREQTTNAVLMQRHECWVGHPGGKQLLWLPYNKCWSTITN